MNREVFVNTGIEFIADEPMNFHTYYRIGGPAALFIKPKNSSELAQAVKILKENSIKYFILGRGSNILVSDEGYEGCIIDMSAYLNRISVEDEIMRAESGCTVSAAGLFAEKNGLSGFEELSGIPGTVGGAVVMNAGCYGSETKDIIHSVTVLRDGKEKELKSEELEFGYRSSNLKGELIISAEFKLKKEKEEDIKVKRLKYLLLRNEKQPVDLPSCGSVFKRPANDYAGRLIEEAGMKGKSKGGAKVSEKHAGFIVNTGNATASDVKSLIEEIKQKVYQKFNVMLEEEVIYL
jgi:UDP-N-acetylmuramate dehydrogenase